MADVAAEDAIDFLELVSEFLDGALSGERERRFIEHLAECSGCESYLDHFRRTIARVGDPAPDNISPAVRQQR